MARLGLSCITEPGTPRIVEAVAERGPVDVWHQLLRDNDRRAARIDFGAIQRRADVVQARYIVPGDEEWPASLDDLTYAGTVGKLGLGGVPLGLWVRGVGSLAEECAKSVAIVGSRASTPYGDGVSADLGAALASAEIAVISGAAFGIDAAAHRGALAVGGRTFAILACGVDVSYPRGNAALIQTVATDHLVISELPPGSHPTRVRFLTRNRLIAALARTTVIVEGARRSGARNTVAWAQALSRPVAAVPGPITSAASITPNQLIRDHVAEAITDAADVLEMIGRPGENLVPTLPDAPGRPSDLLSHRQLELFERLPGRGGITAGDLALRVAWQVPEVLVGLDELEEVGVAIRLPDGRWKIKPGSIG